MTASPTTAVPGTETPTPAPTPEGTLAPTTGGVQPEPEPEPTTTDAPTPGLSTGGVEQPTDTPTSAPEEPYTPPPSDSGTALQQAAAEHKDHPNDSKPTHGHGRHHGHGHHGSRGAKGNATHAATINVDLTLAGSPELQVRVVLWCYLLPALCHPSPA